MTGFVYRICALFCAAVFSAAYVLEAAAARRVTQQAARFEDALVAARSQMLIVNFEDALDDGSTFGTGKGWGDLAGAAVRSFGRKRPAPAVVAPKAAGFAVDWRTETLLWGRNRDRQYAAIASALENARRRGAKVQVVARGRGADIAKAVLRRTGPGIVDRIFIIGRAPEPGDERLAPQAAFLTESGDGTVLATFQDGGAPTVVTGHDAQSLLAGAFPPMERLYAPETPLNPDGVCSESSPMGRLRGEWRGLCGGENEPLMVKLDCNQGKLRVEYVVFYDLGAGVSASAAATGDGLSMRFGEGAEVYEFVGRSAAGGTRLDGAIAGGRSGAAGDCSLSRPGRVDPRERSSEGVSEAAGAAAAAAAAALGGP